MSALLHTGEAASRGLWPAKDCHERGPVGDAGCEIDRWTSQARGGPCPDLLKKLTSQAEVSSSLLARGRSGLKNQRHESPGYLTLLMC